MNEKKKKVCAGCKVEKPTTEYHKHKRRSDGLQPYCKDCQREMARKNKMKKKSLTTVKKDSNKKTIEHEEKRIPTSVLFSIGVIGTLTLFTVISKILGLNMTSLVFCILTIISSVLAVINILLQPNTDKKIIGVRY